MFRKGNKVCFVTPPANGKYIIRDYAGGLGFEATTDEDMSYILPPLDMMQLAAGIKSFDYAFVDAQSQKLTVSKLLHHLDSHSIDGVVMEISIPTLANDLSCADAITNSGIKVIGKVHSSDREVLNAILLNSSVSICLISECEDIIDDILLGTSYEGTARISNGEILIEEKNFIKDLDSLPFPARDRVNHENYFYPKLGNCTTILSSRGCPYPCKYYCPYPLTQGRKWRFRSVQSLIKEIHEIFNLGISRILFRDPVFTLKEDRVKELCEALIDQNITIEWWCETRADKLSVDLIKLMHQAGCVGINIGVESGDSELRYSQLKRGVTDEVIETVSMACRNSGIKLAFLMMVGYPGENRQSIVKTADLLRKCRPFSIGINFPVNHPGTQLNLDARKNKWLVKDDYSVTDGSEPVIITENFDAKSVIEAKDYVERLFAAIRNNNLTQEDKIYAELTAWAKQAL